MAIADTLPLWQRPQYLMERLPQTLLAPDLQQTRINVVQRAWKRDPQAFLEKFVPMFIGGISKSTHSKPESSKATA